MAQEIEDLIYSETIALTLYESPSSGFLTPSVGRFLEFSNNYYGRYRIKKVSEAKLIW